MTIVLNVLDFLPKAEHARIVAGTSQYDCTSGIQKAIDKGDRIFLPAGRYLCKQLNLKSGGELYGVGASSEIKAYDRTTACQYLLATHVRGGGSQNPEQNMQNIRVHDLQLNGRLAEFGYEPFYSLLAINATSEMRVERVTFYGFRGDGIYLGSGTQKNIKRFNQRIHIIDCVFNGVLKNNRNGISVIDCDRLDIDGCTFDNIGNEKISASVGGIDIEPNNMWNICRDISICRCVFRDIDSINTAAITFHNYLQDGSNIHGWTVRDCHFDHCYWGISSSAKTKDIESIKDDLVVVNCHFLDTVRTSIAINGLSGTRISACTFESSPPDSGLGGDAVRLGMERASNIAIAIQAVITGNLFIGIRPQWGVIGILGVNGLVCAGNTFKDISGACISFPGDEIGGPVGRLENIIISGNTVESGRKLASGRLIHTSFLNMRRGTKSSLGKLLLGRSSFEYNNRLASGVQVIAAGSDIHFQGNAMR